MSTTDCRDCVFAAADPDGLFCTHKTSMNPANIWGWSLRSARLTGQPCGPLAKHFEPATPDMLTARGRAVPGTGSIPRLGESDVARLAANVHQGIPVAAAGAQEVTALAVDLGEDGSEHDFEPASSARPHSGAPVVDRNRTAAAGSTS
jgi:hypothetical protein